MAIVMLTENLEVIMSLSSYTDSDGDDDGHGDSERT